MTENRKPANTDLQDLHLSDTMVTMLKERRFNIRLLCELATHKDFSKLLADIEIYIDRIASMQIETLSATVDITRQEILSRYQPPKTLRKS